MGSHHVIPLFAFKQRKPMLYTTKVVILWPKIFSDRFTISHMELEESYLDWSHDNDSKFIQKSYDCFRAMGLSQHYATHIWGHA